MNTFLIAFALVALAAFSNALSAECQAEKEKAKDCVQALFAEAKAKKEQLKADAEACFLDNECTLPSTPAPKPEEKDCRRQLIEQLKPEVESCMQEKDPEFVFPVREDKQKGGHWRGGHRGRKEMPDCPTPEAMDAAIECVKALKGDAVEGKRDRRSAEKGHRGRKEESDEAKKCFEEISDECQAEAEQAKEDLCNCAKQTYEANVESIAEQLELCGGEKKRGSDKSLIKSFCRKNSGEHHKDSKQKGGKKSGGKSGNKSDKRDRKGGKKSGKGNRENRNKGGKGKRGNGRGH